MDYQKFTFTIVEVTAENFDKVSEILISYLAAIREIALATLPAILKPLIPLIEDIKNFEDLSRITKRKSLMFIVYRNDTPHGYLLAGVGSTPGLLTIVDLYLPTLSHEEKKLCINDITQTACYTGYTAISIVTSPNDCGIIEAATDEGYKVQAVILCKDLDIQ